VLAPYAAKDRDEPARCQAASADKSSYLWTAALGIWALLIGLFQRSLIPLLFVRLSFAQRAALIGVLGWVDFVWLHGVYSVMLTVFRVNSSRRQRPPTRTLSEQPAIAILYTTMNDFSEPAAASCVNQQYPRFKVFLLDDSSEPLYTSRVDRFQKQFPMETMVVRRRCRQHFKAGNLNHALGRIAPDYEFFVICDADGVLPPEFLRNVLAHFTDDSIAFVQARQRAVLQDSATRAAADLSTGAEVYWQRIFPHSQRFGFVMFHGHGGMIRTRVWSEVGGFPPVVAEDLEFSTRIRRLGYVGCIADDVVCEEDFPPSWTAFCKRQLKYVRGTCEHMKRDMWPFLWFSEIPWFERADRLLASLTVLSAPMFVMFLMDLLFLLPIAFHLSITAIYANHASIASLSDLGRSGHTPVIPLFTWPFYSMNVVALFLPSIPAVFQLRKEPKRLMHYVVCSAAAYLSSVFRQAGDALFVAVTGRNFFPVTGAKESDLLTCAPKDLLRNATFIYVDLFAATALCASGIMLGCLGVVAPICVAVCVGLAAERLGSDHYLVRKALFLPLSAILLCSALGFAALLVG
jgi:cellulose synthase/poly-beta-1,6-N-acetylglucosamine synthase-like glycosyltransferase